MLSSNRSLTAHQSLGLDCRPSPSRSIADPPGPQPLPLSSALSPPVLMVTPPDELDSDQRPRSSHIGSSDADGHLNRVTLLFLPSLVIDGHPLPARESFSGPSRLPEPQSESESSQTTLCLLNQVCGRDPQSPSDNPFTLNWASQQPFFLCPHPLAFSSPLLNALAKSCYWSTLIRPLLLLILRCHPHSAQVDLFPQQKNAVSVPAKTLLLISAPPVRKRNRTARAFRCSTLVDPSDSSIIHDHRPSETHLSLSLACRTPPRSSLFIPHSNEPLTPSEFEETAFRAQCQMNLDPDCAPEDSLDGDKRHQRYYFVNSYRAKLLARLSDEAASVDQPWHPGNQEAEEEEKKVVKVIYGEEDGLESLDDLLDWDSTTRVNSPRHE